MIKEPPEVQELFDRIVKCLPLSIALDAPIFRSSGVKYANERDFLSGHGAGFYGGRWNPPPIRAVYGSLDPITSVKESFQEFIKCGFKSTAIRPRVLAGVKVKVHRLLDLTDAKVRRRLRFRLDDLIKEDWRAIQASGEESWTQVIGRGCLLAGFEGLLAPSARHRGGRNIILFPSNLQENSAIEPIASDELPPHPSEWPE